MSAALERLATLLAEDLKQRLAEVGLSVYRRGEAGELVTADDDFARFAKQFGDVWARSFAVGLQKR